MNEENEVNVSFCSGTLVHSLLPERLKREVKNIIEDIELFRRRVLLIFIPLKITETRVITFQNPFVTFE